MKTFGTHRALAMAGAVVVAAVAMGTPAAVAAPAPSSRGVCDDSSALSKCQTNGSVSIKATPESRGSGNPDPGARVGSQGRRGCYTQAQDRNHICQ